LLNSARNRSVIRAGIIPACLTATTARSVAVSVDGLLIYFSVHDVQAILQPTHDCDADLTQIERFVRAPATLIEVGVEHVRYSVENLLSWIAVHCVVCSS